MLARLVAKLALLVTAARSVDPSTTRRRAPGQRLDDLDIRQLKKQVAKWTSSDLAEDDSFAYFVARSADYVAVGIYSVVKSGARRRRRRRRESRGNESPGPPGSVFVFSTTTFDHIAKLMASDATPDDFFGCSIAISADYVAVGALGDDHGGTDSGSVYVFSTTTFKQVAKLKASDAAEGDLFGASVAISADYIAVGAQDDVINGTASGSAYVFSTKTFDQIAKLTANDAAENDFFGNSVAISADYVVVGAIFDEGGGDYSGSVYVFSTTKFDQVAKLTASDAANYDNFGISVAISADYIAVDSTSVLNDACHGRCVYVYSTMTFDQVTKLTASNKTEYDKFGLSVEFGRVTME